MPRTGWFKALFVLLVSAQIALAKESPTQVINWPDSSNPVLRFTFSKFKKVGGIGGEATYVTDTTAQNLGSKRITRANFKLYLFDDKKIRVGEAVVSIGDVAPGETIRFQTTAATSGGPTSLALTAEYLPPELGGVGAPKLVSLTVNSVPQGADLKVDGVSAGATPKVIQVGVGKHRLEFNKEGFNTGTFPLEITANDASGGSVSYELGSAAHDTVELRDGSVLSGDVESLSASEVIVRMGGKENRYDRNQVKRILLVERETPTPLPPSVSESGSPKR